MKNRLRIHCIACQVFEGELNLLVPGAKTLVTVSRLEMALHQRQAGDLRAALQTAIDNTSTNEFDAIVLAYGLCNRGVVGLQARSLPVVIPRAHDCIGILLGSARYLAQLESQPGTYFQSPGWLENRLASGAMLQNAPGADGFATSKEELIARYGEDNAQYLLEQFAEFTHNYQRLAFISTPVPKARQWEQEALAMAQQKGWGFDRMAADLGWLKRMLDAEWNDKEFLTLSPGKCVDISYDSSLIAER